jgi:two-component system sensor histidine kinase PilS (NtrC family)
MVRQNAERLAHIAEEVLDIARVQHQISHAPASTLMLDDSVAQICADWQHQNPAQRRASISLMGHNAQIEFDTEHLRRVLFNLLDNAVRYKGPHDDSLAITTRVSPSGAISLQVWSDGAPMDKSVERHLFEPFFSSESRSSGLGLYICRELCQRHGASIGYQRLVRTTPRGEIGGNAFTVGFRRNARPAENATLFDTIVV